MELPQRGVPWVYASSTVFFTAGGIFYLYLAHVLAPDDLGTVVVLSAVALIASTAAVLGLGAGFQHFLAFYQGRGDRDPLRALVRSALATAGLLSVVAAVVVAAASWPLSTFFFHTPRFAMTIELLGLYSGFVTAATILQSVLLGLQRFATYARVYMAASFATYGLPVLFLRAVPGVPTIVLGWVAGSAIGLLLCLVAVLRGTRPLAPLAPGRAARARGTTIYRSLLLYSIPIFASSLIGTSASYVDRLVLASLTALSTVGVYNYAILMTTGSMFLVGPIATVLVPRISALFGRNDLDAIRAAGRTSITLVVLVFVPFALGLAAVGPFVLRLLLGSAFVPASVPLAMLLVISAASIPYVILVALASGVRRTGLILEASALALLANVGLSVGLVPSMGMMGAAVGNSAMYWVALLTVYVGLRGTDLVRFDTASIARIWSSSLAMFVAVALPLAFLGYRAVFVIGFIAVGIVVLLVSLRLVRAVPEDAVAALVHQLPRWAASVCPVVCWLADCRDCDHLAGLTRAPSARDAVAK